MSDYFIAPDGEDEPTLWRHNPDRPECPTALARHCELGGEAWALIVTATVGHRNAWQLRGGSVAHPNFLSAAYCHSQETLSLSLHNPTTAGPADTEVRVLGWHSETHNDIPGEEVT